MLRWALWLLLAWTLPAAAQQPLLRIEAGMHVAATNDSATDAAGRVLVTTSNDKTARVWSLPDLRPQGVLRPPIGEGGEGQLYAVAVSPDGTLAAIGGGLGSAPDVAVLIFDLATRQVVRRLGGLPSDVFSLAFSPDGSRLAAGLWGPNGIRIWDTATWSRPPVTDTAYGGDVYGLAFAPDGRLAAASFDGGLRLYDPRGRQVARENLRAGQQPFRIAFSPDGARLAVGFQNALKVEVHDGQTLKLKNEPDVSGLGGANLSRVAWSPRGELLAAGGARDGNDFAIFAWPNDGTGTRRVLDRGFGGVTFAIRPLPDGRIALVGANGDLRVLDPSGQRAVSLDPVAQDLNTSIVVSDITHRLPLSRDGSQVAWVSWNDRGRWRRFDAARLAWDVSPQPPVGLADWTDTAGAVRAEAWHGSTAPRLGARPLTLEQYETSYSVSAASDGLLLGTGWYIRRFDPGGSQRWLKPTPGEAWRVNQSLDGRLAIAAVGSGTIRWYRRDSGQELLALFVTSDAENWVAWTPSGYYAASPKGEALIGWHVNRGPDKAADWFPVGQFRDRFYRPDVVQKVLATLDEAVALRQADAERGSATRPIDTITTDLPPVVTIFSPRDDVQAPGPDQVIAYSIRSPSRKPIKNLRIEVDGRPVDTGRGAGRQLEPAEDGEVRGTVAVPIPPNRTVTVGLVAETETRVSEPARRRIRGAPAAAAVTLPRLNVFAVGISNYARPELRAGVSLAAKDAADFAAAMERQRGRGLYREVNVRVLPDTQATRANIIAGMRWLYTITDKPDVAVFYLAGHGAPDEDQKLFALPVDADPDQLATNSVSDQDIHTNLRRIPGRVLAFLDICHAGGMVMASRGLPDMTPFVNQLREPGSGLIVFSATQKNQVAIERPDLGNGAFTRGILDGLAGAADSKGLGVIRTDDLNTYLNERVWELSRNRQRPNIQRPGDIPDFPFYAVPR